MAQITAALVKQLREMTNSPMMECKKALVEADGDIDAAVDILRKMGAAKVVKKAGRATNEGAIMAYVNDEGTVGAIAELKCETDFVSGTAAYKELVTKIAKAAAESDPADLEALKAAQVEGTTVADLIAEGIHNMGENMTLARFARFASTDGYVASYIHMGGKIGVLVQFGLGKAETRANEEFKTVAHDVAMQVAAAHPVAVSRESVPQEVIDHELSIYRAQAAESGKPENIQEKIVNGSLEKYFKENTLLAQQFVKNPEQSIEQYIAAAEKSVDDKITVKGFFCFGLGDAE